MCNKPSTMPKPDRRIGTMQILLGSEATVVYSKPRGVLSCDCVRDEARGGTFTEENTHLGAISWFYGGADGFTSDD